MSGSIAKSQQIRELFEAEKLDPAATSIAAVAILCERTVAAPPPMESLSWDDDTEPVAASVRQATFLAGKILPQYQPEYIPAGAQFNSMTRCDLREFRDGESLDPADINQRLATMLAELLGERDLDGCSALSLIGNSPALGETRFGVVAAAETGVQFLKTYTKPLMAGISGTYHEYTAPNAAEARAFLADKTIAEMYQYVEIITPEGGFGKDAGGTYEFDLDD